MNVTLTNSSRGARPFGWGGPSPQWSTSIVAPSNGKYKDCPYAVFQGMVTATSGTAAATILIQATMDEMTGVGVTIPVTLTNSSTTVTLPTAPYVIMQNNAGQNLNAVYGQGQLITGQPSGSFYAVPIDFNYATGYLQDQKIISLAAGMQVYGPGLGAGTTIASITNDRTLVLTAAPSGLATSPGVYWVTFANNFWASLGTITLSGTLSASDGFTTTSPWKYVRANVTAISGTNAVAYAVMGV